MKHTRRHASLLVEEEPMGFPATKGRCRMMKPLMRAVGVALAGTLAGVALVASPASAAQSAPLNWSGYQAVFDNNPGGGAQSWAWLYNGGYNTAYLKVQFYNEERNTGLTVGRGQSGSKTYDKDIWRMQICEHTIPAVHCSAWSY
jgi:hypothetical protein